MRTVAWAMTALALGPLGMGPGAAKVTTLDGGFAVIDVGDALGPTGLIIADASNGWIWASTWNDAVVIHSDGTIVGERGPALDLLVATMEDPGNEEAFPLLPWTASLAFVLTAICIQSCDCCWAYYNNGGTTAGEPPCCDRCFGSLCDISFP